MERIQIERSNNVLVPIRKSNGGGGVAVVGRPVKLNRRLVVFLVNYTIECPNE